MFNLPDELRVRLEQQIAASEHPREQIINIMYALQRHYGYFSDEARASRPPALLGTDPFGN